ncbi:MAB_1171c family putative transporter [Streptacidiphilus cavernicola]|uniref:MAB_1171c family putative transporter n=1 Tax=Streptacidiphilus cavernicola TaxID=3342716 RepID=A0ABV6VZ69_9ACTN
MGDLVLYLALAAGALGIGIGRFVAARREEITAAMRHAYGFAYILSAAMALLAPPTVTLVDRAALTLGLPDLFDLFDLLGDILRCCTACQLHLLTAALALPSRPGAYRRATRRRLLTAAAVVAAMVLLYATAQVRIVNGTQQTGSSRGWLLAGYDALVTGYVVACLTALALRLAQRARAAEPGPLRTGLRLLLLSTVVGLLWTAWGLDDVVDAARSGAQACGEDPVSALLGAGCVGLLVITAATALVGRLRTGCADWYAAYRRYRALTPLWAALHRTFPEIALMAPAGPLPPRNARFALYRRVIEIHDARLLLRRHVDEESVARVRRTVLDGTTPPGRVEATVEAAILATALAQARSGTPPTPPGGARPAPAGPGPTAAVVAAPAPAPAVAAAADLGWAGSAAAVTGLDSEADRLGRVSRAFTRSAEVAAIRRSVRASGSMR